MAHQVPASTMPLGYRRLKPILYYTIKKTLVESPKKELRITVNINK